MLKNFKYSLRSLYPLQSKDLFLSLLNFFFFRCAGPEISTDTCAASSSSWHSATLSRSCPRTKAYSHTSCEDSGGSGREKSALSCGEAHTDTHREASSHHNRETHPLSSREAVSYQDSRLQDYLPSREEALKCLWHGGFLWIGKNVVYYVQSKVML